MAAGKVTGNQEDVTGTENALIELCVGLVRFGDVQGCLFFNESF